MGFWLLFIKVQMIKASCFFFFSHATQTLFILVCMSHSCFVSYLYCDLLSTKSSFTLICYNGLNTVGPQYLFVELKQAILMPCFTFILDRIFGSCMAKRGATLLPEHCAKCLMITDTKEQFIAQCE